MTKRQLIDEIVTINRSAEPAFLAQFQDEELTEYLEHLAILQRPRPHGDSRAFDAYFEFESPTPTQAAAEPVEPNVEISPDISDVQRDGEYDESDERHLPSLYLDAPSASPTEEDYTEAADAETGPDLQPVSVTASTPAEKAQTPFADIEADAESWLF